VSSAVQPGGEPGTNRHAFGPLTSQTCEPRAGIVAPEGGGKDTPSLLLGGGIRVTRARVNIEGAAP
jgi:hypothetical protein